MTSTSKPGNAAKGGFEHQDLQVKGILYFLLALAVVTGLCLLALRGMYGVLDRREKALNPAVNPLVTNVPADTRRVESGYPQQVFPNPKLEEDERHQFEGMLLKEEQTLNSYGWVDEKSGRVRIPIERAMDLIVQRGLPVRSQGGSSDALPASNKAAAAKRGEKK